MTKDCPICGVEIKDKPSTFKKVKSTRTCSRKCRAELLKTNYLGALNPNHKHSPLELVFVNKVAAISANAKKRGLEFSLTKDDLLNQYNLQQGLCYYTGAPMKLVSTTTKLTNQADLDVVSVDRIDNDKGYLKDNIVLCCNGINKLKGSASVNDLKGILNYIISKYNEPCKIAFQKLSDSAKTPIRINIGDVGYDLTATEIEDLGDRLKVHTGISIQPEIGWYVEMCARSSIHKKGLVLANSIGIIDNGFRGEIVAIFYKLDNWQPIEVGERVVQLIPHRYHIVEFEEVNELPESDRGEKAWGSSGR